MRKILSLEKLLAIRERLRAQGKTVVFTNGIFDLLHVGHVRYLRGAKALADVKVQLHCCGGVRPLLPDLIESGLDAINPVQISCSGMETRGLKNDFGDRITLWGGGCDTRDVLPHGSPDQMEAHVKGLVQLLSPGGGFVFQQVHNVLADVPAENIVAMFDAVNRL